MKLLGNLYLSSRRLCILAVVAAALLTACGVSTQVNHLHADDGNVEIYAALQATAGSASPASSYLVYFGADVGVASLAFCIEFVDRSCDLTRPENAQNFVKAQLAVTRPDRKIFAIATAMAMRHQLQIVAVTQDANGQILSQQRLEIIDTQAPQDPPPSGAIPPQIDSDPDQVGTFMETAHSFELTAYWLASPDQLGAGSCLYMSGTGILEFLVNKHRGIKSPELEGDTDISEELALTLSSLVSLENNYTDVVDLFTRYGGFIRSRDLPFSAYGDSSWIRGTGVDLRRYSHDTDLPRISRKVLFSAGGEGTQRQQNVMRSKDLEDIKAALKQFKSPVLFVFQPSNVNYWHANLIVGYDDQRQVFLTRDSSFGEKLSSIYEYGGRSPWGPQAYRGIWEMSYSNALVWGNHATVYYLAE